MSTHYFAHPTVRPMPPTGGPSPDSLPSAPALTAGATGNPVANTIPARSRAQTPTHASAPPPQGMNEDTPAVRASGPVSGPTDLTGFCPGGLL